MTALVVNLYGGPSTGKSTTAAGIFHHLKVFGINCEMALEFAKGKVWEESFKVLDDQLYLFGKQHHKLFRLQDKVDVIITDSPLLMSIHYGKRETSLFHELVQQKNNSFNNMNFFLRRVKKYNPAGRIQTEEEARAMDDSMKFMLEYLNEPFEEVVADRDAAKTIAEMVLRKQGTPVIF